MAFNPEDLKFETSFDWRKNTYFQQVCVVPEGSRIPPHNCLGPRRVVDCDGFFNLNDIRHWIEEESLQPQKIVFEDIWLQIKEPGTKERLMSQDRFAQADTGFPGLISPVRNPDNKPYRMLDGRRRFWKQEASGAKEGLFYVIPEEIVFQFFWAILPTGATINHLKKMQESYVQEGAIRPETAQGKEQRESYED